VSAHTAITIYGVVAVTFMMTMYALERRHPAYILAFAAGCLASAAYGFLSGAWPFGVVEAIWAAVAIHRYAEHRRRRRDPDRDRPRNPDRNRARAPDRNSPRARGPAAPY
jgi:hypothetical protein